MTVSDVCFGPLCISEETEEKRKIQKKTLKKLKEAIICLDEGNHIGAFNMLQKAERELLELILVKKEKESGDE